MMNGHYVVYAGAVIGFTGFALPNFELRYIRTWHATYYVSHLHT
jgi:hypothetical protein